MNEPLLERISQLEHQLRRWRRISVVLAFLLICVVAVAGAYMVMPPTQEPRNFWLWLPWVRARAEREAAEQARQNEMKAMQALEALEVERRAAKERKRRRRKSRESACACKQGAAAVRRRLQSDLTRRGGNNERTDS
jgi:hypothetical protein